jgi:hypothetical protein
MRAIGIVAVLISAGAGTASSQAPSQQQEWATFDVREDHASALDLNSVRTIGSLRRGWYLTVNRATEDGVDYMMANFEVDCDEESFRIRSIASFGMDGSSKGTFSSSDPASHIVPGTGAAIILDIVCRGVTVEGAVPAPAGNFACFVRDHLNGGS